MESYMFPAQLMALLKFGMEYLENALTLAPRLTMERKLARWHLPGIIK